MGRFQGFIGPSYTLRAISLDCQRTVNMFPELDELQTGKEREIAALIGRPGERLLVTLPTSPNRGGYVTSNGALLVVAGNTLYHVKSDWTYQVLGTLNTNSGLVYMADNGKQVLVVDGTNGYLYDPTVTPNLAVISDVNFPQTTTRVTYQDGYFIVPVPGTQKFQWSDLYDGGTWDALDFASSEGSPDNLVTVLSDHRELWLFNTMSTEVFYNSGNTQTFERIQGAFIEYGCASPYTPLKVNNAVIWLSTGVNGNGLVLKSVGYQPQRISNHAIEAAIRTYGDLSKTVAWTYSEGGHHFYALQFVGANTTWVYDDTTGVWHEWTTTDPALGQLRFNALFQTFAYNVHVVGNYQTGDLYALDPDYFTDNGNVITAMRTSPHLSQDMVRFVHHAFQLDMEVGVGLDGSQQGTNPQVMLSWSDDYGRSWSSEHWTSAGAVGEFRHRAIWRRLGVARDRVYKVVITDPVRRVLVGAQLLTVKGRS